MKLAPGPVRVESPPAGWGASSVGTCGIVRRWGWCLGLLVALFLPPRLAAQGAPPAIIEVIGPVAGSYRVAQILNFTVNFSAPVTVTGTPQLSLIVGSTRVNATYSSGSPGTNLIFSYFSQSGDTDPDGIAVVSPLLLAGGSIRSGNTDAVLTFTPPDTSAVLVDTTPPTVVIGPPSVSNTSAGPVSYTVTYADSGFRFTSLDVADITLRRTGSAAGTVRVTGSGVTRTVTISDITGAGTLGISIAANTAYDLAGNSAAAAGPSATFAVAPPVPNAAPSFDLNGAVFSAHNPGRIGGWGEDHSGELDFPAGLTATAVAAGYLHGLAVRNDGTVVAWGVNLFGETAVPAGLTDVTSVVAGRYFSVALKRDGTLVAWGVNERGQLNTPAGLTDATALSVGFYHGLALRRGGTVVGWGDNNYGQAEVPAGLTGVVAIAAGALHSLALRQDGTVMGWGFNGNGVATAPAGLSNVVAIAAGFLHSLALREDGTVVAWGGGNAGQATVPPGLGKVVGIAAGVSQSVVLKRDGTLTAWGAGGSGELNIPADLTGATAVQSSASSSFTLVRYTDAVLTVVEDSGAFAVTQLVTNLLAGPISESTQTVSVVVLNNNHALFSVQPAIDAAGTLTFVAAPDASGRATLSVFVRDDGGTAYGGVDTSAARNFTLAITSVNDAPTSFLPTNQIVVLEDVGNYRNFSFARFSTGPANESDQRLTITASHDNPGLFSAAPAVTTAGLLSFTPAPDANGKATVTIIVQDDGGTANGGVDRITNTFTITVLPVNDPPSVTLATNDVVVLEDSGTRRMTLAAFSPGPPDEAGQSVVMTFSNDRPGLFSAGPTLDLTGTLTFTPATNANGVATITIIARDDGGTANGGVDRSTNTFTITVTPVNDAPTLAPIANRPAILEDAGPQTIDLIGVSAGGSENQTLTVTATSSNPSVIPHPTVTYTSPAASGSLTYTPVANANGTAVITVVVRDDGGRANGGVDAVTNQFTVTVLPVNDPPTAALATNNVVVLEDSGPYTNRTFAIFRVGPADEVAAPQSITNVTILSVTNASLFSVQPALTSQGVLTFTPAASSNGTALVTFRFQDNGGTANNGGDTTTNTFLITVAEVNDVPTLAALASPAPILEDAGSQTMALSGISAGSGERQNLTVTATSSNPALIPHPTVTYTSPAATGSLSYTPVADANGTAVIRVVVTDDGGTANGGSNAVTNQFTVTVVAVNDPPLIALATNQVVVREDSGSYSAALVTFAGGPGNESGQSVTNVVTSHNNAGLFSAAPSVALNGRLTFTPVANVNGMATVTVIAQDNGGTLNGGVDKATNTFTITVTAVNNAPGVVLATNNVVVLEDSGPATNRTFAVFTVGPANETAQRVTRVTILSVTNATLFSAGPALGPDGVLTFTPATNANGRALVTFRFQDDGGTDGGGVDQATNAFLITVLPVSDAPAVSFALDQVGVEQDSGTHALAGFATFSAGPDDESPQRLAGYTVTVDNAALFSAAPALSNAGLLTFTPTSGAHGVARVTVVVQDDGVLTNGGVNRSTNAFVITVALAGNTAPTVARPLGDFSVKEDSGTVVRNLPSVFADAETPATSLFYRVVANTNAALVTATIANGTNLVLTFASHGFGTSRIAVSAMDAGGRLATNAFVVTVNPVNDPPSVRFATNQVVVLEDAGPVNSNRFVVFSSGPPNESGQTVRVLSVANNRSGLFSTQPALDDTGTLTFTPAANSNGVATVTVVLQDNGGVVDGGVDTVTNTFTITVTAVNDAPTLGAIANPAAILEDAGRQTVSLSGISAGRGESQNLTVTATSSNEDLIPHPTVTYTSPAATGSLSYTPVGNANGTAVITVVVMDDGGTANDGVDKATNTFTITVTPVNDAPTMVLATNNVVVLEDAGARAVAGFATFSAGPPNESAQTPVGYTVSNNNPGLFRAVPAIDNAGVLTFTPAANSNGVVTVTVVVQDSGGTANGGVDRATNTFTITVTPVNDAPTITLATNNVVVLEDSGAYSAALATFTAGPATESGQTLTITTSHNNPGLFSAAPAIDNAGRLTFTPAANFNGVATVTVFAQDNGGTANGGVDRTTNTFTITVTPVNDAPTITLATNNVVVLEDSGAYSAALAAFTTGPANESGQALTITTSHNNPGLFSAAPSVSAGGVLTFAPAPNSNGVATVTIIAQDSRGTADRGVDKATNTFTITITVVNDAPTLALATNNVAVLEDAGARTMAGFATFSAGPPNESAQSLVGYTLSNNNAGLFSAAPAIDNAGRLTFTPAANSNGVATVTVVAQDSGGTANGGVDKATNTFVISVAAVNDAPTVTFAANTVTVLEDNGLVSSNNFVVFSAGPLNESAQTLLGYTLSNNNPGLFSAAPALDNTGRLAFTPAANSNGVATVTVVVQDSGETANGGVDKSTNTFGITVTAVNDAPSVSFAVATVTVLEDSGAISSNRFALFSAGPANEAQTVSVVSVVNNNSGLFSAQPAINNAGVLTFTPAANSNGVATVTVVVQDSGGTANGGVDKATNTFVISVAAVNDAPTVTFAAGTVTVLEDNGAVSSNRFALFGAGPANEAQTVTVVSVVNNNRGLFSAAPAIDASGVLTFTPAANSNGVATVTVVAQDSGGTANGGVDKVTNIFTITVTAVNDAPTIALATNNIVVLEDSGAYSAALAAFSPGPANESGQGLTITTSHNNPGLFSAAPSVSISGVLAFTPAVNANGVATVTVVAQDSGGTANGGVDRATNTFTITVTAVNDAPAFVLAGTVDVDESSGAYLRPNFASGITPGPANEASQTVAFALSNTNAALFSVAPFIDGTDTLTPGTLHFTPAPNAYGVATITVTAHDNGGTVNGGIDTSAPRSFTLTVHAAPVNTVPGGQTNVSNQPLFFTATNAVDNSIRVADPDSSTLTTTLTVTNGTLSVAVTNGLTVSGGDTAALVLSGPITNLNAALQSLSYRAASNAFGPDQLLVLSQDEGGRTNRMPAAVSIMVEAPALGGLPRISLAAFNTPTRRLTNVVAVAGLLDTNYVQGVIYDPVNQVLLVQAVGRQDGSTNRTTLTLRAQFGDGTAQVIEIPVIFYQPLLTGVPGDGIYSGSFSVPLFNPQTSLFEQKVVVSNHTPFSFTALRITATNLPATITLRNATITNGGLPYVEYNLAVPSGGSVTLTLEYFNSSRGVFPAGVPGLRLELLNQGRPVIPPDGAVPTELRGYRGFTPDGKTKFYIEFPTRRGTAYYVQYMDAVGEAWRTSPVIIHGTGHLLKWLDDGPPNTDTPPTATRFYRIIGR